MNEKVQRIATKVESVFAGLVYVHKELTAEIRNVFETNEYVDANMVFEAINAVYPIPKILHCYVLDIIANEL